MQALIYEFWCVDRTYFATEIALVSCRNNLVADFNKPRRRSPDPGFFQGNAGCTKFPAVDRVETCRSNGCCGVRVSSLSLVECACHPFRHSCGYVAPTGDLSTLSEIGSNSITTRTNAHAACMRQGLWYEYSRNRLVLLSLCLY